MICGADDWGESQGQILDGSQVQLTAVRNSNNDTISLRESNIMDVTGNLKILQQLLMFNSRIDKSFSTTHF